MPRLICPLCPPERTFNLNMNLTDFLKHVQLFHSHQPGFSIHVGLMDASDPSQVSSPFATIVIVVMVVTPVWSYSRMVMILQELVVMMVKVRMVLMVMVTLV